MVPRLCHQWDYLRNKMLQIGIYDITLCPLHSATCPGYGRTSSRPSCSPALMDAALFSVPSPCQCLWDFYLCRVLLPVCVHALRGLITLISPSDCTSFLFISGSRTKLPAVVWNTECSGCCHWPTGVSDMLSTRPCRNAHKTAYRFTKDVPGVCGGSCS